MNPDQPRLIQSISDESGLIRINPDESWLSLMNPDKTRLIWANRRFTLMETILFLRKRGHYTRVRMCVILLWDILESSRISYVMQE